MKKSLTLKMKIVMASLATVMTLVNSSSAEDDQVYMTISSKLGQGFGKVIEIEGKVFIPPNKGQKGYLRKKMIEVRRIGTRRLTKPLVIELATKKSALIIIPASDTQVKLRGYESGYFSGTPHTVFAKIKPVVAGASGFGFVHIFEVTKLLEPEKAQQN